MSLQALNTALTGLRVAQQQLNVISNNVANVGTDGYTRKILPQSSHALTTGQGIGVMSDVIVRKVDMNLSRDLWTQVSAVSASEVRANYLSSIETFNGPPDKGLSIAAYIGELRNQFAALADSPNDGFLMQATLNQAQDVASKFNDFGKLITQLRADAQDQMMSSINTINSAANEIADLNIKIKNATAIGRTTADLEDRRDIAIKKLAAELDITYFRSGDGVMVVQTSTDIELASEKATPLHFTQSNISPTSTYPGSLGGIYTNGAPGERGSYDIAQTDLGGRLGSLVELRDKTLVEYQAQIDELAHKLAMRFDAQGLRLFTDRSGTIPSDAPPNPNGVPPTGVAYVGFATNIQVNRAIVNDISLLQKGTYVSDKQIPSGSSEVIRRIIEFTFGSVEYQQASGNVDLRVGGLANDLQEWLGLYSENKVVGSINLSSFPQIDDGVVNNVDLAEVLGDLFPNWPNDDRVEITYSDPRTGQPATTITLDLSAAAAIPLGGGVNDALDQIITYINDQLALSGIAPEFAASATRNSSGQLVLNARSHIEINANGAGGMGEEALRALGLRQATFAENNAFTTKDPYFDVQIGNDDPVRITIEPGDTHLDLINKLRWDPAAQTGVEGLLVDFDSATGFLTLRPGMDPAHGGPSFGGDIRLIPGSTQTNGAINPALGALPGSVGIISALFGSYSVVGGTITERAAIVDVPYGSETRVGSGVYVPYRSQYLGQNANMSTQVMAQASILDFAQKIINRQSQDLIITQNTQASDTTLRDLLQRRLSDDTGVNIDEELSNLIVIQTAYSAAARAVSAADEMFKELINSLR